MKEEVSNRWKVLEKDGLLLQLVHKEENFYNPFKGKSVLQISL